jgi:hypothetical protein
MTRQEYIQLRQSSPISILYEKYKEHFEATNTRNCPFLNQHDFLSLMQTRLDINMLLNTVVKEYDEDFNIVFLFGKDGKLLKIM